ncbi:MAG: 16S rRNA (guanine(527)-N(7))-methyltransferase RsmG [Dissulfurimicrobium sp.]|uniref:16S rRNA (guanine(527)-N(7))-methyltransferase RsmG n=1 Tax=Dissulfurimicrobium sp. TaxID=2022436 RepID=UPI00404AA329
MSGLFEESGLAPAGKVLSDLHYYISELANWNQRINLTGIVDPCGMALKHVGDAIVLAQHIPEGVNTVLDIGTGAGAPGLVLKLIRQDLDVVLVDAVRKKVSFLKYMIASMGLSGVCAEHGRVGMSGVPAQRPKSGFDLVVSQAVGPVDELVDMSDKLLTKNGTIISLKGAKGAEELEVRRAGLLKMGWDAKTVKAYTPITRRLRYMIFLQRTLDCGNNF